MKQLLAGKSFSLVLLALMLSACGGGGGGGDSAKDTTAPTLTEVTAVLSNTSDNTPSYTFNTTEAGRIDYSGGCIPSILNARSGTNTVTFRQLSDGLFDSCRLTVTDTSGNESEELEVSPFTVDTVQPTLNTTTAIITPSQNRTPVYVFNSSEAGALTLAGGCTATTDTAVNGRNEITFNSLEDGSYNCTVTVIDAALNARTLTIPAFSVDNVAPGLAQVTPVSDWVHARTANYAFSSNEIGTIRFSGDCTSTDVDAVSTVNNVVVLRMSRDGVHSNCTLTVEDLAGNVSDVLAINTFTVDTIAPTLTQSDAVIPSVTNDSTPQFTFNSTEAGRISFVGGLCLSVTTTAASGSTSIVFTPLIDATHNCTLRVTDDAGNQSELLTIPTFRVDTTGPVLTAGTPISPLSNNRSPSYQFGSDETGTVTLSTQCINATSSAVTGGYRIDFSNLSDNTYSECVITVTDVVGNFSTLTIPTFVVDATAPELTAGTPVAAISNNSSPEYSFTSSEIHTVMFDGACAAEAFSPSYEVDGDTITVSFVNLSDAEYTDCDVIVTDAAQNASTLEIPDFTVDATAPSLTGVFPVASPTNAVAPSVVFNSDEVGTITHNGACGVINLAALNGSNTVTLNGLVEGSYTCTLTVTDEAQNASTLEIPTFIIDRTAPSLTEVSPVEPELGNDATPDYTFRSTEAGTISYQNCASSDVNALANVDTDITFSEFEEDGTYSNCQLRVTDAAGNTSTPLTASAFTIDTTAPVLTEVAQVPNDYTQTYTFHSSEAGAVTYRGECAATLDDALASNNPITLRTPAPALNSLPVRFYQDCTIQVTDAAGNDSAQLEISAFRVGKPLNDTGITLCGDYADVSGAYTGSGIYNNDVDCESTGVSTTEDGQEQDNGGDVVPAGQDAVYGRDADPETNDDSDGLAGFSYTKLGADGEPLVVQGGTWSDSGSELDGTKWSCVLDNVTGLTWEVKTNDGGLHDVDHRYSWYNSTGVNNGGSAGASDRGDICLNTTRCDTEKYVVDVNAAQLCGKSDWRLPTLSELRSLRSPNVLNNLDRRFFYHVSFPFRYWSSIPVADNISEAWAFVLSTSTNFGAAQADLKTSQYQIRLVRSNQ